MGPISLCCPTSHMRQPVGMSHTIFYRTGSPKWRGQAGIRIQAFRSCIPNDHTPQHSATTAKTEIDGGCTAGGSQSLQVGRNWTPEDSSITISSPSISHGDVYRPWRPSSLEALRMLACPPQSHLCQLTCVCAGGQGEHLSEQMPRNWGGHPSTWTLPQATNGVLLPAQVTEPGPAQSHL